MTVLSIDECSVCTGEARPAPVGYEPLLERVPFHAFERATPADWAPLVAKMTDVQKMVHLTGRMTVFDNQELGNRLFTEARETYRQTLSREAMRLGCKGATVPLAAGPELSALRGRADWAAASVGGTYNLNLAREIFRIHDETPTANRHVYAHRLYYAPNAWDKRYWADKSTEISQVETMTSVNAATADFYVRNGDIAEATANVIPFLAVCEICQAAVAGNPYRSVEEVYRQFELPAHLGCPHHARPSPKRKLTTAECGELWVGQ